MDSISQTLTNMILSIDVSKHLQNDLLEGVLYVLLEHIGKVLSVLVFKELRSNPGLRACSSKLPLPSPLADDAANRTETFVTEYAAMLQSQHLVWILERVLSSLDYQMGTHKNGTENLKFTATPFSDILSHSKKRLQKTLLKGVFGHDDPEFQESLNLPREVIPTRGMDLTTDNNDTLGKDRGDWFVEEVWRLLGWDSLMDNQGC